MSGNQLLLPRDNDDNDDMSNHKNDTSTAIGQLKTDTTSTSSSSENSSEMMILEPHDDNDNHVAIAVRRGMDNNDNDSQQRIVTPGTISTRKLRRGATNNPSTSLLSPTTISTVKRNLFDNNEEDDGFIDVTTSAAADVAVAAAGTNTASITIPMTPPPSLSLSSPTVPIRLRRRRDDGGNREEGVVDIVTSPPTAKRRLAFGKYEMSNINHVSSNIESMYRIIHKRTNSIGGNGSFGPIYGELTIGSMQRMINFMKLHTGFNKNSRFIDIGSGIGKPNLHVTQDPGVQISYGIECENSRWLLSINSLHGVLDTFIKQQQSQVVPLLQQEQLEQLEQSQPESSQQQSPELISQEQQEQSSNQKLQSSLLKPSNCIFVHANIHDAKTFDPFTHVYMFSIGFPPDLWIHLSKMWNTSSNNVKYLICYHNEDKIIDTYDFHVKYLEKISTSMYVSSEGHTGYLYERIIASPETKTAKNIRQPKLTFHNNNANNDDNNSNEVDSVPCDPLYRTGIETIQRGTSSLMDDVWNTLEQIQQQTQQDRRRNGSSRRSSSQNNNKMSSPSTSTSLSTSSSSILTSSSSRLSKKKTSLRSHYKNK